MPLGLWDFKVVIFQPKQSLYLQYYANGLFQKDKYAYVLSIN